MTESPIAAADERLAPPFRRRHFPHIGSTNDEALAAARRGDASGLWIVADEQVGGKGRQGRTWSSPAGNLYASLLLIDPAPMARAPELGFVAGVALLSALREGLGNDPRLRLKWPNDILFDDAKLVGILLEATRLADGSTACVMGFGINCRSHPQNTPYRATNLAAAGSSIVEPDLVFAALWRQVARWLDLWQRNGFAPIREVWLGAAAGLGRKIVVAAPSRSCEGLFRTIDAAGRLVVDALDGPVAIEAGDVFFAPNPNTQQIEARR